MHSKHYTPTISKNVLEQYVSITRNLFLKFTYVVAEYHKPFRYCKSTGVVICMSEPTRRPSQFPGLVKAPNSLRIMQIIVGAIMLVLAGIVLTFPGFAIFLVALWLSISLLFGGIEGIIMGIGATHMSKGWRAISIGIGAVAIGLSIAVFSFPTAAALTLVLLLSIALLFLGAGGIAKGVSERRMPGWARIMFVAAGAITLGLSILVMMFPVYGLSVLFVFIAAALTVNGVSHIIAGITGAIFRQVMFAGRRGGGARRFW